jgi:hypothetical protein
VGQLLADRQSHPDTAIFSGDAAVGLGKGLKQSSQGGFVHADAGIDHGKAQEATTGMTVQKQRLRG